MHRLREQETLPGVAPHGTQPLPLIGILDALGDGREAEALTQLDDRPRQRPAVLTRVGAAAPDERAIDLQDVDGKTLQIAERGLAGSEVIDREADAECLQGLQELDRLGPAVKQRTLGELEDQRVGRKAGARHRRLDVGH